MRQNRAMRAMRLGTAIVLPCVLLLASACATFGSKLESPEVFVTGLKALESDFLEQRFESALRVQNPNEQDLELDGIDVILVVNGRRLGRAMSGDSVTVPRLGEAVVTLHAVTTVFDLLRQLATAPVATEMSYELSGRVFLAKSPGWLSFSREGVLGGAES